MKSKNIFWGFLWIFVGVSVLLNQLNILPVLTYSIIVSIVLGIYAFSSIFRRSWGSVVFPLLLIVWINRELLGIEDYIEFIPLMLAGVFLSIGLSIIFKKQKYYKSIDKSWKTYTHGGSTNLDGESVTCRTSFGSNSYYVNSTNLKEVYLSCQCGDMDVYLNQATIDSNGATLYFDCKMGTIKVYIQRDCRLDCSEVNARLSGFEVPYYNNENSVAPILYLKGDIYLANVQIVYI